MIKKELKSTIKKTITNFRTLILSRHPTHNILRSNLPLLKFRSLVRLGSTTIPGDNKQRIEINSVEGIKNSSSKLRMKQCFTRANVQTAEWYKFNQKMSGYTIHLNGDVNTALSISELKYPIIAKSLNGSRGRGNTKLNNQQELERWLSGKTLSNYIFEKFYSYSKEYRLHVTNEGCFYTCRKLLKNENSEDWQRHDNNCVWIMEENPKFMKPANWNLIVEDCIRAKNALELDICAFDVLVQGSSKTAPKWIICESCSAPSFGNVTAQKYLIEIPKLINKKYNRTL